MQHHPRNKSINPSKLIRLIRTKLLSKAQKQVPEQSVDYLFYEILQRPDPIFDGPLDDDSGIAPIRLLHLREKDFFNSCDREFIQQSIKMLYHTVKWRTNTRLNDLVRRFRITRTEFQNSNAFCVLVKCRLCFIIPVPTLPAGPSCPR